MRVWILAAGIILLLSLSTIHSPQPYEFPDLLHFPAMPESEFNPVSIAGVDLGRHLFYDPVLSRDSSISCSSCHKQESAFSDSNVQFSKGIDNQLTRRNTMPLFNLAWYPALFWDGRVTTLEEQVFHPVMDEREMDITWSAASARLAKNEFYKPKFIAAFGSHVVDSTRISLAIAQFLRTLISHKSKYDRVLAGHDYFTEDEYAGFLHMNDMTKGDCLHCHTSDADALGTIRSFSNNGLDSINNPKLFKDKGLGEHTLNPLDNGKFKIPSLRNVALTAPYMHDGRFRTLEAVIDFYSEGVHESANIDSKMGSARRGGVYLTEMEKCEILAFLHTFTDSVFITSPEHGNPFIKH